MFLHWLSILVEIITTCYYQCRYVEKADQRCQCFTENRGHYPSIRSTFPQHFPSANRLFLWYGRNSKCSLMERIPMQLVQLAAMYCVCHPQVGQSKECFTTCFLLLSEEMLCDIVSFLSIYNDSDLVQCDKNILTSSIHKTYSFNVL